MQVVHEVTLLNGQYLVEGSGDVEAQRIALELTSATYLVVGQVASVRCSEVEFVSVLRSLDASHDGAYLGQFHLCYAPQLVSDLLLLCLKLCFVWQVLPLASSASAEVLAERCRAYITINYYTHHLTLSKGVLLAPYLDVAHVARDAPWHEDHHVSPVEEALSLGCYRLDGYCLKQWQCFFCS